MGQMPYPQAREPCDLLGCIGNGRGTQEERKKKKREKRKTYREVSRVLKKDEQNEEEA
jgi:hypothetical protein